MSRPESTPKSRPRHVLGPGLAGVVLSLAAAGLISGGIALASPGSVSDQPAASPDSCVPSETPSAAPSETPTGAPSGSSACEHYELDLKLWIPQGGVVDPANPTATLPYVAWRDLVALGLEPDLSNPNPLIGPFEPDSTCEDPTTAASAAKTTVSSIFDGDGYKGYDDGTTFRAAATVSFDWNGSNVSNISFTPSIGISHRFISEKTPVDGQRVTLQCVEYHPGTATVSATAQNPSTVFINMTGIVGFLTDQAAELGAYPSNTWKVLVNPDGSLSISYAATEFPTTGLKVLINGQVQGTDIVNDASCYTAAETLGPPAVGNFERLFHTLTKGSLPVITPGGPPSNADLRSPGCIF